MTERLEHRALTCVCAKVRFEVIGAPILAAACYCADCHAAASEIGSLPRAPSLAENDGGTECLLYRKDRIACVQGEALLRPIRLNPTSATKRLVAGCCNSAVVMSFDDSRHWVSAYRRRLDGTLPPIEMRICTGETRSADDAPNGIPSFKRYPARMMVRLVVARLAMTFDKGETING